MATGFIHTWWGRELVPVIREFLNLMPTWLSEGCHPAQVTAGDLMDRLCSGQQLCLLLSCGQDGDAA